MFSIGFGEILVIGVLALLVIGPRQLPQVARVLGRLIGEFKKATQDLSGGLLEASHEVKSAVSDAKGEIQETVDGVKTQLNPNTAPKDNNAASVTDEAPGENASLGAPKGSTDGGQGD